MLGEISESPRVAARIASPSSSGPASLSRKPVAPARNAPWTYSSRSKVVMTTTAIGSSTPGPASCRVASTPSRTGIRMSIRQTSGRSSRASRTASCPSRASPTTSMPSRVPRISRSPVRTRSWSSATSTRMRHAGTSRGRVASTAQPRPGHGPARQVPPSSVARSTIPISPNPDPGVAWAPGSGHRRRRRAAARTRGSPVDAHVDQRRVPGMAQGVGDSLLRDPEDGRVDRRRETGEVARERHLHPRPGRRAADQPLEVGNSRLRGVVGGCLVAQHAHHGPHLGERARRLHLDHLQGFERRGRAGRRERAPGLGLDGDRRDVVGDRVVQLARELDPLLATSPARAAVPGRRAGCAPPGRGRRSSISTAIPPIASPTTGPADEERRAWPRPG